MSTIIFVVSLLWPATPGIAAIPDSANSVDDAPIRYRGIELLLARFEADAQADPAQNL